MIHFYKQVSSVCVFVRARLAWVSVLVCGLLCAACATPAATPLAWPDSGWPVQLHGRALSVEGEPQDRLLVVQREGAALRFLMFDPLGVPLARQILDGSGWHNEGLLPPLPGVRELYASVLQALDAQAGAGNEPRVQLAQVRLQDEGDGFSAWQGSQRLWTIVSERPAQRWTVHLTQPVDGAAEWIFERVPPRQEGRP